MSKEKYVFLRLGLEFRVNEDELNTLKQNNGHSLILLEKMLRDGRYEYSGDTYSVDIGWAQDNPEEYWNVADDEICF